MKFKMADVKYVYTQFTINWRTRNMFNDRWTVVASFFEKFVRKCATPFTITPQACARTHSMRATIANGPKVTCFRWMVRSILSIVISNKLKLCNSMACHNLVFPFVKTKHEYNHRNAQTTQSAHALWVSANGGDDDDDGMRAKNMCS